MTIQLIDGRYSAAQAAELASVLVQAKIFFLEKLIQKNSEEEVKMREARIKTLQNELRRLKASLDNPKKFIDLQASIVLEPCLAEV